MKEEVLDLRYDFVFKELFSRKSCRPYLATIIHICTGIDKAYLLQNMVLSNTNIPIHNTKEKRSNSDILVRIENGFINLEMNRTLTDELIDKNNYYISQYRAREYEVGKKFISRRVYIQINIDNYQRFKKENKFIYTVKLLEQSTLEEADPNQIIYHINLEYLRNRCYNELNEQEKQFVIFIEQNKETLEELYKENEEVKKVVNELADMWFDEDMVLRYDGEKLRDAIEKELVAKGIQKGVEEGLAKGLQQGIERGIQQGIEQGIQQGIEQGIEQGIAQGKQQGIAERNIEIARKLKELGTLSSDQIAIVTELTREDVEKL